MKQQRIYIDTSVVGGFFDTMFEMDTKLLFKRLENKEIIFVTQVYHPHKITEKRACYFVNHRNTVFY